LNSNATKLASVLHLSTIEGEFDNVRDIALGPHYFIGRDEAVLQWRDLIFAEPFSDEPAIEIAENNFCRLVNHVLPDVAAKLNTYHGISYSIDLSLPFGHT
jgi:hypothetical protein